MIDLNPTSHPVWAFAPVINRNAAEFMKSHGLNYFQYLRCYLDGSVCLLVNRTDLFETLLMQREYGVLSSFEEAHQRLPVYTFLWDEELPHAPVAIAREKHGMLHGMTIVKRHKLYYDMIGFAMSKPRSNIGSYYLNHIKNFEIFSNQFINSHQTLMSLHEKEKIILPQSLQDSNREKICLPKRSQRFQVQGRDGMTYLTSKEIFCLELLKQRKTYKEISRELSISVRTVETYLNRIQIRTGYKNLEWLCPE